MPNNLYPQATYQPQQYQLPNYLRQAPPPQELQQTQQVPQMPMYSMQPMMQANYIKGRPVVSIDEARASQIDLDGSLFVFPDIGNKRIYTKQINLDGTANFSVYEKVDLPQPIQPTEMPQYVTRKELDSILNELRQSMAPTQIPVVEASSAPQTNENKSHNQMNFNL